MPIALSLLLTLLTQQVFETYEGIHGKIAGDLYRETPHFQIYAEKMYVPVDLDWLEGELERIHAYLIERTGVQTSERFAITFRPPDTAPCPIRGLARFDDPGPGQAIIFSDEKTSRTQLSGVLAHEVGHLFHARVLKTGTYDMNLVEGFATWEAGKYWQAWLGTPTDNVRVYRREKRYIPLETSYREAPLLADGASCLKERELRYNSWGAFIDFLITDYGMDKFRQLLGPKQDVPVVTVPTRVMNPGIVIPFGPNFPKEIEFLLPRVPDSVVLQPPPMPDFKGVYGQTLGELEEAWLKKLDDTQTR